MLVVWGPFSQDVNQPASDLCDLHRMGQPCPMKIAFSHPKHLRLALQSAKAACVHEPRPVALVGGAWVLGSVRRATGAPLCPVVLGVEVVHSRLGNGEKATAGVSIPSNLRMAE